VRPPNQKPAAAGCFSSLARITLAARAVTKNVT
jgi:hypothetical protein